MELEALKAHGDYHITFRNRNVRRTSALASLGNEHSSNLAAGTSQHALHSTQKNPDVQLPVSVWASHEGLLRHAFLVSIMS